MSGWQAIYSADASGGAPLAVVSPDEPMLDFWNPLPSPDGRRIAFSDGKEELLARGDGSGAVVLTRSFVVAAAWSPDSTRIAWVSFASGVGELHVIRADGTGDHVVRSGVPGGEVVWSHDGRRVRVRTETARGVVSPDGRWIAAYTSGALEGFAVMRTGTSESVARASGSWLTWSPDSRRLAYATASGIVVLDVRTGRVRLLTSDLGSHLRWSPDGATLAYLDCCSTTATGVGDIRTVTRAGSVRIVVRGADAGVVTDLAWARAAPGLAYNRPAAVGLYATAPVVGLAADGDRVAYSACGTLYLWTPADGSLAAGPGVGDCGPGASRVVYTLALAGARLAYGTIAGGLTKSWAISTDVFAQSPQLLTSAGGDTGGTSYPVVAAQGSLVVYADRTGSSTYGSSTYTWTVRVPGGQPLISFEQNWLVPVALDVDGDRVLVARDGAVDVVLSENGGTVFHLDVAVDPSLTPFQRKPPDAQLDGAFVAVRDGGVVDVYDVNDGSQLHTWPLPSGSTLLDSAHGLLAVSADGEVYVVRLTDGLRARVAAGTLAAFMDDGLAIANGARVSVVPYTQLPSFAVRTTAKSRASTR